MKSIDLKSLNDLFANKSKYFHSETTGHNGVGNSYDGVQGEYNETFKFYKHPALPEGVFLKETYNTDSYGYEERIVSIQFVEGVEKTVKVFEPIK